jgi:primosomal replication protein N
LVLLAHWESIQIEVAKGRQVPCQLQLKVFGRHRSTLTDQYELAMQILIGDRMGRIH